jgi:hypothetical protein
MFVNKFIIKVAAPMRSIAAKEAATPVYKKSRWVCSIPINPGLLVRAACLQPAFFVSFAGGLQQGFRVGLQVFVCVPGTSATLQQGLRVGLQVFVCVPGTFSKGLQQGLRVGLQVFVCVPLTASASASAPLQQGFRVGLQVFVCVPLTASAGLQQGFRVGLQVLFIVLGGSSAPLQQGLRVGLQVFVLVPAGALSAIAYAFDSAPPLSASIILLSSSASIEPRRKLVSLLLLRSFSLSTFIKKASLSRDQCFAIDIPH